VAEAAIRIGGVAKHFEQRRGQTLEILSPIDLNIAEGEFLSLVGPSGCGKSTLLNIISGLLTPSSGNVSLSGRVGYMFQTDALLPWRSILRNVRVGLDFAGVPGQESDERARQMLATLGLEGFENHYPAELSGGMRQRASLARMWVTNPDIILMDEPFGALDSQTRLVIQAGFLEYWERHRKTVLLVTHDIEEAVAMSDRVIVMSARPGAVIAEHGIDLPRPRSIVALRGEPEFSEYWKRIWSTLEAEATRALKAAA
jgi:NitT/TauT family transport system ATP-binding protein